MRAMTCARSGSRSRSVAPPAHSPPSPSSPATPTPPRHSVAQVARALDLDPVPPWHTNRAPFTRYADALVRANDAWGHIANDVLLLARPEIAELAEPVVEGRGGSSTMPQKANPVLSLLIRRAALAAPGQAAQLHLAAATVVDERPDGAWYTEWSTLAALSRHTLTAASQTTELLDGLRVDTGRMAAVVKQQSSALLAEQRNIRAVPDPDLELEPDFDPSHYLGATGSADRPDPRPCSHRSGDLCERPDHHRRAPHRRGQPRRAAAAGARPLHRNDGLDTVDRVCGRTDRCLRRRRVGPAGPRLQPHGARRVVHHVRAGPGRAQRRRGDPRAA